jgi:hypothetical protein
MKINKTTSFIETFRPNRWLLRFPDNFNIKEFCVSKISNPKYNNKKGWKKITIRLYDLIGLETTKNLIDNISRVPVKLCLEKLDHTGVCVEKIEIYSKKMSVDLGKFDYSSEKLSTIKVKLKPMNVIVL